MPASARYSAAARELVAGLRSRGYRTGCRAVEQWAAWGLAPAPGRIPLGRHGFTSQYPEGAVDQYAAVASVMRRGQDWRTAGVMLIGRGYLIPKPETFRLLMDYLFTPDVSEDIDPMDYADEQIAAVAGSPLFKRITRIARRNISAAKVTDPVTGTEIDPASAAESVIACGIAGMLGMPMSRSAAEETAAAWGMITADLPPEVREHRIDFVNAISDTVLSFEHLASVARTVDPARLQAQVLEFRRNIPGPSQQILNLVPAAVTDMLSVATALAVIAIEDLGGADWIERISPGLAASEACLKLIHACETA